MADVLEAPTRRARFAQPHDDRAIPVGSGGRPPYDARVGASGISVGARPVLVGTRRLGEPERRAAHPRRHLELGGRWSLVPELSGMERGARPRMAVARVLGTVHGHLHLDSQPARPRAGHRPTGRRAGAADPLGLSSRCCSPPRCALRVGATVVVRSSCSRQFCSRWWWGGVSRQIPSRRRHEC